MAAAAYRYLFCDLVTNAVLAELPLKRVKFDSKLNDIGSFSGVLGMADPQATKLQPWSQTPGGRTALYVDRGGRIVWGGVVITRRYSQGRNAGGAGPFLMEIGASEFMWYFNKRLIVADAAFTAAEQMTIPGSLINTAQGVRNGNIGVQVPAFPASGVVRTQTWAATERKKVAEAIRDMSVLDQGFDWAIRVDYGLGGQPAGTPGKQLALGYPRSGNTYNTTGWVFEYPGNVVDYMWPEDSSLQAVTAYVQGSGSGTAMTQSSSSVTSLLDAGYPQLDEVFQAKDQADASVIGARAIAHAKAYSSPVTLPELLVRADLDPVLGSYAVGDDALVRITSPQFPAVSGAVGYSMFWRIVAVEVTPQDSAKSERVKLTLGAIPT